MFDKELVGKFSFMKNFNTTKKAIKSQINIARSVKVKEFYHHMIFEEHKRKQLKIFEKSIT